MDGHKFSDIFRNLLSLYNSLGRGTVIMIVVWLLAICLAAGLDLTIYNLFS